MDELPLWLRGKESTCQCRRHRICGFNPWVGKIPGGGNGNPLWYSCLQDLMDRGAWQATVHGVAKSWTRLSNETITSLIEMTFPQSPYYTYTLQTLKNQDHCQG